MTFNVFSKLTGGALLGLLYAFAAFWGGRDGRFQTLSTGIGVGNNGLTWAIASDVITSGARVGEAALVQV